MDALSAESWAAIGYSPLGDVPHAEFMGVRVFDSWVHEQDVRRALDRPGGDGNIASEISLDHVQRAMPFVVGKKAGCADGTAVRFDVAGPGRDARAFTIAVDGGAGPPGGRRRRADGDPVALQHRLRRRRLRPDDVGTPAGDRRGRRRTVTAWRARSVLDAMNFMF